MINSVIQQVWYPTHPRSCSLSNTESHLLSTCNWVNHR